MLRTALGVTFPMWLQTMQPQRNSLLHPRNSLGFLLLAHQVQMPVSFPTGGC